MTSSADAIAVVMEFAQALLDPSEEQRKGESEKDYALRLSFRNRRWEAKEDAILDRLRFLVAISGLSDRAIRLGIRLARWKDRPRGRTLRDVIENPPPPIRWVVSGIIREGLNLLSAVPKAGKSTMGRALALAVACGGKALGSIDVDAGDVLLISLEDGEATILADFEAMCGPDASIPPAALDRITIWTEAPRFGGGLEDEIERWIISHSEPRLIVVDCYGKIAGSSKTAETEYERVYRELDPLKEIGNLYQVGKPSPPSRQQAERGAGGHLRPARVGRLLRRPGLPHQPPAQGPGSGPPRGGARRRSEGLLPLVRLPDPDALYRRGGGRGSEGPHPAGHHGDPERGRRGPGPEGDHGVARRLSRRRRPSGPLGAEAPRGDGWRRGDR